MISRLARSAGPSLGDVLTKAFSTGACAFAWAFGMAAGAISAQRIFGVEEIEMPDGPPPDEDLEDEEPPEEEEGDEEEDEGDEDEGGDDDEA